MAIIAQPRDVIDECLKRSLLTKEDIRTLFPLGKKGKRAGCGNRLAQRMRRAGAVIRHLGLEDEMRKKYGPGSVLYPRGIPLFKLLDLCDLLGKEIRFTYNDVA